MDIEKLAQLSTPFSVLAAGILIAGAVLWNHGHPAVPTTAAVAGQPPPAQTADISKVKTAGDPYMGNPNALITIAYWYDYQCPFCQRNEEQAMPQLIKDYVDTGEAQIVIKDFQFLGADSQTLGQTARGVWEVAPDKFYAWHKAVYDSQGTENTGWATPEKIRSITVGVLGATDTDKVLALVKTNGTTYQKAMDTDKAEGSEFGVTGTPSFIMGTHLLIGAQPYSAIKQLVDLTLEGK